METIKVHITKPKGKKTTRCATFDPESGKQMLDDKTDRHIERAAKPSRRLARGSRVAGSAIEAVENDVGGVSGEFTRDYLDGLKTGTAGTYESTLNVFEQLARPGKLAELTTAKLTAFVTALREQGRTRRLSHDTYGH